MKELIKIGKSGTTGNPVVNARDLHTFLEVGKDFSTWLKDKLSAFKFKENIDYARIFFDIKGKRIPFPKNGESDTQVFERIYRIEYALTLRCAKKIAMVQNNEKGDEARDYFIDVEARYYALKEGLSAKALKPAVITYSVSEVARKLELNDYFGKIGRNRLFEILRHKKIVDENNQPIPKYVKKGYFTITPTKIMLVCEKGLKWLNQEFCVEKTNDVVDLKAEMNELKNTNHIMLKGITALAETILYNKGGKRTEEQNRISVEHLRSFLELTGGEQKALNK